MIGKVFPAVPAMPAFLALAFLAILGLFPELAFTADSCYSCMTCTTGTEAVFTAAVEYVGTTDEITDYTNALTFPVEGMACPTDDSAAQKDTNDVAGTPCVSGYWVFKDSDGAVVQSCTIAVPLEDMFKAVSDTLTADTLKTKMGMLTEAGVKADLAMLTSAEDKKGTSTFDGMFTICTTDDCNTPKENDKATSTVDLGAYVDAAKHTMKTGLFEDICDSMVTATKGALGHDCTVDSAGATAAAAAAAAGTRARRDTVANDMGKIEIILAPGLGYTAANIASAYATAKAAVTTTNAGNTDELALLGDFAATATFEVTDNSEEEEKESFSTPIAFSSLLLPICFSLKAFL